MVGELQRSQISSILFRLEIRRAAESNRRFTGAQTRIIAVCKLLKPLINKPSKVN